MTLQSARSNLKNPVHK